MQSEEIRYKTNGLCGPVSVCVYAMCQCVSVCNVCVGVCVCVSVRGCG